MLWVCHQAAAVPGAVVTDKVIVTGLDTALSNTNEIHLPPPPAAPKRVAVLISGSGTGLQSLINDTMDAGGRFSHAIIALVIANVPGVTGIDRATKAGIPTAVINHKQFANREAFEDAVHVALVDANIELVCLAGFMRILTATFVDKWTGRLINIHPSLLPSFKVGSTYFGTYGVFL